MCNPNNNSHLSGDRTDFGLCHVRLYIYLFVCRSLSECSQNKQTDGDFSLPTRTTGARTSLVSYNIIIVALSVQQDNTPRSKIVFSLVFTKIACKIKYMIYCFCKRAATHCHDRRNSVGGHLRYLNNTF